MGDQKLNSTISELEPLPVQVFPRSLHLGLRLHLNDDSRPVFEIDKEVRRVATCFQTQFKRLVGDGFQKWESNRQVDEIAFE